MAGSGYALIPEVGRPLKLTLKHYHYDSLLFAFDSVIMLTVQVCIYFDHQLLRGNRSTKTSSTSFSPYASPNFPPLARLGMNVSSQFGTHTHTHTHTHTLLCDDSCNCS